MRVTNLQNEVEVKFDNPPLPPKNDTGYIIEWFTGDRSLVISGPHNSAVIIDGSDEVLWCELTEDNSLHEEGTYRLIRPVHLGQVVLTLPK